MKLVCPAAVFFALLLIPGLAIAADAPDFNHQVRPILSKHCFQCHGPDEEARKADLRLDSYAGATEDRDGERAIDPKHLSASELISRIKESDPDEIMPPPKSKRPMSRAEIAILERWVKSGAQYDKHWAFTTARKPKVPKQRRDRWSTNGIDKFIQAKLTAAKLEPQDRAAKSALLRRATFDLTGLPPTLEELDAYMADKSGNAYETVVDRLLASEHYGERMTLAWMDAARYGDSSVMHADGPRFMWAWRDWVIDAYNTNKPFNDFTVEQLAGDLMPKATTAQKVASGFNRNHASSDEGGAFPEELRVDYIVDRVMTTANVFMGLSMECAQCHDHKYDPISNKEYYEFFAYFNNNADPGMQTRSGNQAPVVDVFDDEAKVQLAVIKEKLADVEKRKAARRLAVAADIAQWVAAEEKKLADGTRAELPPPEMQAAHRYTFSELGGTKLADTGFAEKAKDALLIDADGDGTSGGGGGHALVDGQIRLYGGSQGKADYIKLPKGLFDGMSNTTIEIWATGHSPRKWSRIFDFGNGRNDFLMFTWSKGTDKNVSRIEWAAADGGKTGADIKQNYFYTGQERHIVCTISEGEDQTQVKGYIDGVEVVAFTSKGTLGKLGQNNLFVGRSQYPDDIADASYNELRVYNRALSSEQIKSSFSSGPGIGYKHELLATPAADRTDRQQNALADICLSETDDPFNALQAEADKLQIQHSKTSEKMRKGNTMIMGDNPADMMRVTYMLDRGQYDAPNKEKPVEPGVPAFLPPLPKDAPANRLGLAQWLTQPDHPLTARVAVNRYWMMLFGRGLVPTVTDFGNQGQSPSHPQLLDWLAVDFVDSGWDVKRMIKQMVMSSTYTQSVRTSAEALAADSQNILFSRGPRFRLQGEFIRDNALALSGLLVADVGGQSVKPYQPAGIWNEVSLNGGLRYQQDSGEKLYRRSMYTYWKRSAPAPNMMIFDAPTREKCVVQRPRTNTPLQALVTLNDIHFIETSRKLAARIMKDGGDTFEQRIDYLYRLSMSRSPDARELAVCKEVFEHQLASFTADPKKAAAYLKYGESAPDAGLNPVQHAAYMVIANMILNLDEVLTRG